jgi:hypothetical protein
MNTYNKSLQLARLDYMNNVWYISRSWSVTNISSRASVAEFFKLLNHPRVSEHRHLHDGRTTLLPYDRDPTPLPPKQISSTRKDDMVHAHCPGARPWQTMTKI